MQHLGSRALSGTALAFCLLVNASCSSVFGGLGTPDASPPQVHSPCELPYTDKAGELSAQPDLDAPLPGDGLVGIIKDDAAAYNAIYPRYNANIDWAGAKCEKKQAAPIETK